MKPVAQYLHNPNRLNFTHEVRIDYLSLLSNGYTEIEGIQNKNVLGDTARLQAEAVAWCKEQGWLEHGGQTGASNYDFAVETMGFFLYVRFQKREQAMIFRLRFG